MFIENGTQYDDNGIPLGVRVMPDGSLAPRVDAYGFARPINRYLTYSEFTKMDDDDPDNQKIKYFKSGYHVEWENVKRDLFPYPSLAYKLGVDPKFAYQIGALAVDSADEQGTPPTSGTNTSYNHTCTGSNLILVSGVYDDNGGTIGGWTYPAGTNLTVDITQTAQLTRVRLAHLVAPSTGANALKYTLAGSGNYSTNEKGYIFGISFTGAKQTGQPDATVGESANAASASASITTVADNCYVIDCIAVNTNPITKGASQTVITGADTGIANAAGAEFGGSYKLVGAAGAYTMTWSWSNNFAYDHCAESVSPAPVTTAVKQQSYSQWGWTI